MQNWFGAGVPSLVKLQPALELRILQTPAARVVEVNRGRVRETLLLDACRHGGAGGSLQALDAGRQQAFSFAEKITVVPIQIAVRPGEDDEPASRLHKLIKLCEATALQAIHIGEHNDLHTFVVGLPQPFGIHLGGADQVFERGAGRLVGSQGQFQKVGGSLQRSDARIAIDKQNIQLVTHLHHRVEGIVVREAVTLQAHGQRVIADLVESVRETDHGLAFRRQTDT